VLRETVLREKTAKSNLPFLMKSNLNKEGENNSVMLKGKFEVLTVVVTQIVSCDV
jgi:hypothetical protein